jgi:hypothetical protein
MTAAKASKPEICTDAQDKPTIRSAGMGFFHNQDIIQANVHTHFPLMASQ